MVWQQHLQDLAAQTCLSKPDDTERRIGHSAPKRKGKKNKTNKYEQYVCATPVRTR
jgi:hypothetical protein